LTGNDTDAGAGVALQSFRALLARVEKVRTGFSGKRETEKQDDGLDARIVGRPRNFPRRLSAPRRDRYQRSSSQSRKSRIVQIER
jgi:hypothetical protein